MSLLIVFLILAVLGAAASVAATILRVRSRPVTADFLALQGVTMRRIEELTRENAGDVDRARELADSLAGVGVGDYTENEVAREHVDSVIGQLEGLEPRLAAAGASETRAKPGPDFLSPPDND